MPDPITHAVTAPAISIAISSAIAAFFGIDFHSFVFAFIGSWIAAALLPTITFKRTLIIIIVGTIASSALIPIALKNYPEYSQTSISFVLSFVLVRFHQLVMELSGKALERLFGKIGA
jgi:apolipoprotein N-acyltransferase